MRQNIPMVSIQLKGLADVIKGLQQSTSKPFVDSLFQKVGKSAAKWVADWYAAKGENWFDSPESPTHGPGREDTNWVAELTKRPNWRAQRASSRAYATFTLSFIGPELHAAQFWNHVRGAVITPKKASVLTIPIVPQAHGKTVAEYRRRYHKKVFRPRGKDYLAVDYFGKRIRPIYLLRPRSVLLPMRKRNGHEPCAWRDADFRPFIISRFEQGLSKALKGK